MICPVSVSALERSSSAPRDPKIENLHLTEPAVVGRLHQHVARLQVAVNQPQPMRVLNGPAYLAKRRRRSRSEAFRDST